MSEKSPNPIKWKGKFWWLPTLRSMLKEDDGTPAKIVTSVNGQTGDVTVETSPPAAEGVTSYNGKTGAVTGVESYNGKTGIVTGVESYNNKTGAVTGVESFNGKSGAVTGVASFNGATGAVTGVSSVNGSTGAVTITVPAIKRVTIKGSSLTKITHLGPNSYTRRGYVWPSGQNANNFISCLARYSVVTENTTRGTQLVPLMPFFVQTGSGSALYLFPPFEDEGIDDIDQIMRSYTLIDVFLYLWG